MKKRIYLKQWLLFKPYNKTVPTDIYYLKLSNQIKTALTDKDLYILQLDLSESQIDLMSCFLASYFEDIISETNIWNSFINKHFELYNKKLPFYDTTDYCQTEINEQDVSFLIWYFLNTVNVDDFLSPYNNFIAKIAVNIMQLFEEEYEYALENDILKSFYQIDKDNDDYYIIRGFLDTVLFRTYLFFPDIIPKFELTELEILEQNDENILSYLKENRDLFLLGSFTELLSLKSQEWAAEILGKEHPLNNHILNISQKIVGLFLYKGQDENDIDIEHIASGKVFKMTKKSFDDHSKLTKIDTILYIGIVQWKSEWWFSGVYFSTSYKEDLILEERDSLQSRMAVNFIDHQEEETNSLLQKQMEAFLAFNNDSLIAFMPTNELTTFFKKYIEYFNSTLKLSKRKKEKALKRIKGDGFFDKENNNIIDDPDLPETGLLFFNPKSGGEIAYGINSAFPLKDNPYFNIEESEDNFYSLLMSQDFSKELAMYCIDNCKNELPFLNENGSKKYLDDIDFLLRFWKIDKYYSFPSITFTGKKE